MTTTAKTGLPSITRVQDIMTDEVLYVDAGMSVFDAAKLLSDAQVSGAPVRDGDKLVGVVSKSDLVDPRNELEVRAVAVMTKTIYAVRATDPALLAINLMVDESIHRALVVDDDGNVVGIVAPMDVCRAIRRGMRMHLDDAAGRVSLDYVDLNRYKLAPRRKR